MNFENGLKATIMLLCQKFKRILNYQQWIEDPGYFYVCLRYILAVMNLITLLKCLTLLLQ